MLTKNITNYLIFVILLTSVLSIPIKSLVSDRILGGMIFTIFEISLYCLMFARVCISGRFTYHPLELPVFLYLFYGLFLTVWSYGNGIGIYSTCQSFRLHFLPVILYFAVRQHVSKNLSFFTKAKRFIFIVIIVVIVELFCQYFGSLLLGLNINMFPWVKMIQEARVGKTMEYLTLDQGAIRVVGMFGYIHPTGLLATVGFIMFLFEYRISNRKIYKYLSLFCLIGIFIAGARTSFVSLTVVLIYLSIHDLKVRKSVLLFMPIVIAVSIIYKSILSKQHYVSAHLHNMKYFFSAITDSTNFSALQNGGTLANMMYFIFGVGFDPMGKLNLCYVRYSFLGLEIGLIEKLLFYFGFIFVFILGYLFFQVYKQKTFDKNIVYYRAIIVPFVISLGHYAELFTVGVLEVFFVIYALIITYIIKTKYNKRFLTERND